MVLKKGRNIFVVGFSGSGKTTVGREVANILGWKFVDLDQIIVDKTGRSIESIFEEDGEIQFRNLEHDQLLTVSKSDNQVISTGGGIVTSENNRRVMKSSGIVVCLEASPEVLFQRLNDQENSGSDVVRPMLSGTDPMARLISLKRDRQYDYAQSDWIVNTDQFLPNQVAVEIVRGCNLLGLVSSKSSFVSDVDLSAIVNTADGDYPIWSGWDILPNLGDRTSQILSPGCAYVVADEGSYKYARRAQMSLENSGIPSHILVLPPGEQNKTLENAARLYEWLAELRAERGHLLVAVGGGMIGDLVGFVAATYVRGMRYAQVPTTLLAMMDSSIGGKTAVDLPQGKNLVGAFHQPVFVLQDVSTLVTLPKREIVAGWAEAIKHGLILDPELLQLLTKNYKQILNLDRDVTTKAIGRSVAVKSDVVSRDENETLGLRVLLNYGHTIAHALEAATGYGSYLHGEAVAIGMVGAGLIATELGMFSHEEFTKQKNLIESYGLPTAAENIDPVMIRQSMNTDKKVSDGVIRWVLLDRIGSATTRRDVPDELVMKTLRTICK